MTWRNRETGTVHMGVVREKPVDPALPNQTTRQDNDVDHLGLAVLPEHGGGQDRIVVGFKRFEPPQTSSLNSRLCARQVSRDLATVGGLEQTGLSGLGPGFATGAGRVWVLWRDMGSHSDQLGVAPYDMAFDLPPELAELLQQPCDPRSCPPDPRLVCTAIEEFEWAHQPAWIRIARKGDLVITPASGSGMIRRFPQGTRLRTTLRSHGYHGR